MSAIVVVTMMRLPLCRYSDTLITFLLYKGVTGAGSNATISASASTDSSAELTTPPSASKWISSLDNPVRVMIKGSILLVGIRLIIKRSREARSHNLINLTKEIDWPCNALS
jgi:hypothetical protein